MGRLMRRLKKRIADRKSRITDQAAAQRAFEDNKPDALKNDIRMISGCEDKQTSADVSNVHSFQLPDPAGQAGGAWYGLINNNCVIVLWGRELH
jgi:hypothetical protein